MRTVVVLPTYNEAATICEVLQRVRDALPAGHILVVDDSSPDGTADVAKREGESVGGVDILVRPEKSGLGGAYRTGFAWGLEHGFDTFVEMDSDLSHDPADLPRLLEPVSRGVDLVIGSRYVPGGSIPNWALHRRLISRAGNIYAAKVLALPLTDLTSGFRAYSAQALQRIDLVQVRADSYGFQIEMAYLVALAGGSVAEVPIRFVDRAVGESKMSAYTVAEALALVSWWGARRLARRTEPAVDRARAISA